MEPASLFHRSRTTGLGRAERLAWLVRLRWAALICVFGAGLAAPALGVRGVHQPVLLGAVALGVVYNAGFSLALRRWPQRVGGSPLLHALLDFGALTLVLWASGGVRNPFLALYTVHVLLLSTLAGKRAAILACSAALSSVALLGLADVWPPLRIATLHVPPQLEPLFGTAAFAVTIAGLAYVVDRANSELARRTREAEILLGALDRLEVGVEVLGPDGTPVFRNRHLLDRWGLTSQCPRDSRGCAPPEGKCPVDEAREGRVGSCRFSTHGRVIELLSFPLGEERPAPVLRLHLDRTELLPSEKAG